MELTLTQKFEIANSEADFAKAQMEECKNVSEKLIDDLRVNPNPAITHPPLHILLLLLLLLLIPTISLVSLLHSLCLGGMLAGWVLGRSGWNQRHAQSIEG